MALYAFDALLPAQTGLQLFVPSLLHNFLLCYFYPLPVAILIKKEYLWGINKNVN